MEESVLPSAVGVVPAGPWAVGVSGGADSVALLTLLRRRDDLSLHVVHLDHQTRASASDADAQFVRQLCGQWNLPCTVRTRREVEESMAGPPPPNPSARYRAARLWLFRRTAADHGLQGVILAHHADDQAETVLLRLLRGSGASGLAAMSPRAVLDGLTLLRPLLAVRGADLRQFLLSHHQPWREDRSNSSPQYLRNRVRQFLLRNPGLTDELLGLSAACQSLRRWVRRTAPTLEASFAADRLADLPPTLARESARRWLADRGVPADELSAAVADRLRNMAADAASPPRIVFPGQLLVRRKQGRIGAADDFGELSRAALP